MAAAIGAATLQANCAADMAAAINADATLNQLVFAFAPAAVCNLVATQPGILGNMTVTLGNVDGNLAPVTQTPVDLTGGAPNVGTAFVNHVHRSGSITIQNWVTDPNFTFPAGAFVVASASGSPMPALVDNKVSSAAGASAISGQDIAAILDAFMTETVSGGQNLPITNCVAGTLTITQATVGPLDVNLTANAFVGNTITFDGNTTGNLAGVSRVITANDAANLLTWDPPLPVGDAPVATDTFVITATQISDMTSRLLSSPGEAGRALDPVTGLPTGAITEGANTGSPANNSNVTPVAALAMMASYKFGLCLTGGGATPTAIEPNLMLTSKLLSDVVGLGMTLDGFPHYPLVDNAGPLTPDPTQLTIRMPVNVGERAIPTAGTLRIQAGATTASDPNFAGISTIEPAPGVAGHAFSRGPADANGVATITLGGAGLANNFDAGARVYLITPAMNGPKKHGFEGEVKSYDYLSVLEASVQNMLNYQTFQVSNH